MSTVMLRTVLLACAISGALVFACGEDTTTDNNSSTDDDDEADDDDDDAPKKDAGPKKDASTSKDGGKDASRDSGGSSGECTGPGQLCVSDTGEMGFQICNNGKLGACTTAGSIAGDAATVETCPDGFMCQSIPMLGSFCSNGTRLTCQTADDCEAAGLEGASCTMIPVLGSVCQLRCTGNGAPSGGGDAGGGSPTGDSGSSSGTGDSGSSSSGDAGRDSGSSSRDR